MIIQKILDQLQGPCRKRHSARLVVHAAKGRGEGGASWDAALSGSKIRLIAPALGKVEIWTWMGWKTVWDGSKAATPGQSMELEFAADALVRAKAPGFRNVVIGLVEDKPSLFSEILPTVQNIKEFFGWIKNTLESIAVHALLVAVLFWGNHINLFDLLRHRQAEQTRAETQPIEVLMLQAQNDSAFNGRNLSPVSSRPQQTPEQKAGKIAEKLTSLMSRLSSIKMPGLRGNLVVSAVDKDSGSRAALLARLEQGKQADVSGNLKMLTSGNAGDSLRWRLYSTADREITLHDQEQVIELFKQLQPSFRACYDNALLKDEELSVTVQYEAEVAGDGRLGPPHYTVVGKSTPRSQGDLTGCITKVLNTGKVSKNLSGVKIKNEFIFRS